MTNEAHSRGAENAGAGCAETAGVVNDQQTLFDVSALANKAETPAVKVPEYKYYLRGKRADGKLYILWRTHDGEAEYYPEDDPQGRKPRYWNTLTAAQKARKMYGGTVEVIEVQS